MLRRHFIVLSTDASCFNSDVLAEFHLPRTGIEVLVDKMQFPSFSAYVDRDALLFLAVCSIRRLLNRVHSTLHSINRRTETVTTAPTPPASKIPFDSTSAVSQPTFENVCSELIRQLNTWYESLPDEIKPNLNNEAPSDLHDGWLRLRYWSAMHIIGRPFVTFVVTSPKQDNFPPHVMKYCRLCLDSCRSSIAMASHILSQRTPYTWIIIHASVDPIGVTPC